MRLSSQPKTSPLKSSKTPGEDYLKFSGPSAFCSVTSSSPHLWKGTYMIALQQRESLTAKMSHLHFLSGVLDLRLVRDLVFEGLERRPVQRTTSSTINRSSTTEPSTWDWFFLAAKDIRIWSMFDCWYTMKTFLTHQIKGTYMDVILLVHYYFLFPRIFILIFFSYHTPYRQH